MKDNIDFSVLICTYNRPLLLNNALRALIATSLQTPDEIVVVNSGDARADEIVRAWAQYRNVAIHLIKVENRGPAANRNAGLPFCRGKIIAITDDDAEVAEDWVIQMKRIHSEFPEAGAVGGKVIGFLSEHNIVSLLSDLVYFPSWPRFRETRTLPTVNISYKRAAVDKVGRFDETLRYGEDVDFNWRIHRLGFPILYSPEVVVQHHNLTDLREFFRRQFLVGRYYYIIRRKWPDMYSVFPRKTDGIKSILRLGNFFLSAIYKPFFVAKSLPGLHQKILSIPILWVHQFFWRSGIICQAFVFLCRNPQKASGKTDRF